MKEKRKFVTSAAERGVYGLYTFGTILSYYLISSYLQLYMTDAGISAFAVGVIFMFAKVWDAVNDPLFGVVVDKVNLKGGKYRPWLRIASIVIPITSVLLFVIPAQASVQVKIIWSSVAYVLWDTAYTLSDVPVAAMTTTMTNSIFERNKMYSISAFLGYLGGLIVVVGVPMLYPNIGWGMTAVLVGILCLISMTPLGYVAKERFVVKPEKDPTIKEILLSYVQNKYLLIWTLAAITGGITDFSTALSAYVAIHCLGSQSYITLISLATAVPVLFVVPFVPKLLEKVDKFNAYIITRVISIVLSLAMYLCGYQNVGLFLILMVIRTMFSSIWGIMPVMFIADCVEYGHFTKGVRNQGIAFSTKTFTNKIIAAFTGALGMFGLAAVGFVEGEGVVQSAQTIEGLWTLYGIGPIVGSVICIVIMLTMYKLRDKDVKLMIRCNSGEITREEAEAGFSKKF